MKKAIMQSKWRWYIPVISIFFVEQMAEWAISAEKAQDIRYRARIILLVIMYQGFSVMCLMYSLIK